MACRVLVRMTRAPRLGLRLLPSSSTRHLHPSAVTACPTVIQDEFLELEARERREKQERKCQEDREEGIKEELLDRALEQVLELGWSREAVRAAAVSLGHPSTVAALVRGGGAELVLHHMARSNQALDSWMEEEVARQREGGGRLMVGKFVREAVVRRLRMNGSYVRGDRMGEAMALTALPPHCAEVVAKLQELCDDVWHRAGDASTDYNWYTKRLTLAAVYTSTEVFMLQDRSEEFTATWAFLDRRLQDLQAAPTLAKVPEDLAAVLGGLATTARNMAGMQK